MNEVLEYIGTAAGLVYLYLEIKQHRAMWLIGLITSLIYVFVFLDAKFYAGTGMHIYYVVISIYGFRSWSNSENKAEESSILYQRLNWRQGIISASAFVLIFIVMYRTLTLTDTPVAFGDAFVTSLSIVATWMLARRIIEHWLFWVVANALSVYLCYTQGLYPTFALYLCYTIMAFVGFYIWTKNGTRTNDESL
jgi:nicotinamide mononucleotide transporter PnuC